MSKLLLTLTEQELHGKIKYGRRRMLHELTHAVRHQRVKFNWMSRQQKDRLYKLCGTVVKAGLDYNDDVTLVVKFINPETETEESVVRYIKELIE